MFFYGKINGELSSTNNENMAKAIFAEGYVTSDTDLIRGWDGKLYVNETDIPPKSPEFLLAEKLSKINVLEDMITPRRIREAMLGNEESIKFIKDIEAQIAILRGNL